MGELWRQCVGVPESSGDDCAALEGEDLTLPARQWPHDYKTAAAVGEQLSMRHTLRRAEASSCTVFDGQVITTCNSGHVGPLLPGRLQITTFLCLGNRHREQLVFP